MTRILQQKKKITYVSGSLILVAILGHFMKVDEFLVNLFMLLAAILALLPILIQAYQSLKLKIVSIDVLVSVAGLGALLIQNYEEAAIVAFLFLFGALLEQRTLNKTKNAIQELVSLVPDTVTIKKDDGTFVSEDLDFIDLGAVIQIKTGERIATDGIIVAGEASIDESSITGEPIAVYKQTKDVVYAGTIVQSGTLEIEVTSIGEATLFGKIVSLVEDAQNSKSKSERFINKFSQYYTPLVVVIALILYVITKDVKLAITILVLGCPGALVIGIPVSNVAGIGRGAREGILLKGSEVIQNFSKTNVIVFDKTGTLTQGKPKVIKEYSYGDNIAFAQQVLFSVESESNHPLAASISTYFSDLTKTTVERSAIVEGKGIEARVEDLDVFVGNEELMLYKKLNFSQQQARDIQKLKEQGASLVICAINNEIKLILGIKDVVREDAIEALRILKVKMNKKLIVLSGDHQQAVDAIAKQLNIDEAHGNMLPSDKAEFIKNLQEDGNIVTFIGDGINDSPSLAYADIGIAMGSGTDVALETSDVVLIQSNLVNISRGINLAKAIHHNMIQNIVFALGTVILLVLSLLLGDFMTMGLGMLIHEASILFVIINGMRLLRKKI